MPGTTALPLSSYAALGDGRSIALVGANGSIDWWCLPNTDSEPIFDRLLDNEAGAAFCLCPGDAFQVESRGYRDCSNVLETVFSTASGRVKLVESLNSGPAGRLPWTELARRVECLSGSVRLSLSISLSRRADTVSPYVQPTGRHEVFHVGRVLGVFVHSDKLKIHQKDDTCLRAELDLHEGEQAVLGLVAGEDEPLVVPTEREIDERIERSDVAWREWVQSLSFSGEYEAALRRSALSLKFLIHSPSGAIAAAATTSLPEKLGGHKNYDYRYAWIRDASYTIKALLTVNAKAEADAAYRWLLRRLDEHGACVCYTLQGDRVPDEQHLAMPGYRGSTPVSVGNRATKQHQHGIYGDIFGTTFLFVKCGGFLDAKNAALLSRLADECADRWRQPDSGMWELENIRHYTISKISCWEALARAVELADAGYLPTLCRDRWSRERDRIAAWVDEHCWSEAKQAYTFYAGTEELDAALALAVRFRFDGRDRLASTLAAIDRELGCGPFHYRYTGMQTEEGCFIACTFWMIEAYALLDQRAKARPALEAALAALKDNVGILSEMIDPSSLEYLGNLPQGLSHLALIQAISELAKESSC